MLSAIKPLDAGGILESSDVPHRAFMRNTLTEASILRQVCESYKGFLLFFWGLSRYWTSLIEKDNDKINIKIKPVCTVQYMCMWVPN
jgi:hypothetical protein